jgi:single-stranded DNA-binding protein
MNDRTRIDERHDERPDRGQGGHHDVGHGAGHQERHHDDHHDGLLNGHPDDHPGDHPDGQERLDDLRDRNQVVLAGRLPEAPVEKLLPSGDRMTTWRVIVRRPAGDRTDGRSKARVDSIPCVTFDAALRGLVAGWRRADFVEVGGMIRRRFWRTPEGGAGSRIEVDVRRARRLERAPSSDEPSHRGHDGGEGHGSRAHNGKVPDGRGHARGHDGEARADGRGRGAPAPDDRGRAVAPGPGAQRAAVLT